MKTAISLSYLDKNGFSKQSANKIIELFKFVKSETEYLSFFSVNANQG
jgi:hypothetical protein